MATCKFCGRAFGSAQGVYAHLKSCPRYQTRQRRRTPSRFQRSDVTNRELPLPRLLQAPYQLPAPLPSELPFDPGLPQEEVVEELARLRKEVQTHAEHRQAQERDRQEKTRAVLQDLKFYVVDLSCRPWNVPREAGAAAKVAIELKLRELSARRESR